MKSEMKSKENEVEDEPMRTARKERKAFEKKLEVLRGSHQSHRLFRATQTTFTEWGRRVNEGKVVELPFDQPNPRFEMLLPNDALHYREGMEYVRG